MAVSGSVNFYLRMFNAKHPYTLPRNYTLTVHALSRSWDEGVGLDMETYKDEDASNWMSASSNTPWTTPGGDIHLDITGSQPFDNGTEDLLVDVTDVVEQWIGGNKTNNGFMIKLSASLEQDTTRSYYTKKFFARSSEFFFKRPVIEARWNSALCDDRGTFYASSSLAGAADNLNTIYLYNNIRGQLKDIPGINSVTSNILVGLYTGSTEPTAAALTTVTGTWAATGTYSASVAVDTAETKLFDVWYTGSAGAAGYKEFFTGSIDVKSMFGSRINPAPKFVSKITNLKPVYYRDEEPKFRLFVREKDWDPTIYTVANTTIQNKIIEQAYYKVVRLADGLEAISYGTGSNQYTKLSYDVSGNYFDLDMSLLEARYMYGIKFAYYVNGDYQEQKELFKFRVE
jgi:hypothetical protein